MSTVETLRMENDLMRGKSNIVDLIEVRAATIEECAREVERWPLDPFKMEDSARWGKHGLGNAIAGTCNALVAHLRALDAARRKP